MAIQVDATHKVVVQKWSDDEWRQDREWTLFKLVDGEWVSCRRDDPADADAFAAADDAPWLEMPVGEYEVRAGEQ